MFLIFFSSLICKLQLSDFFCASCNVIFRASTKRSSPIGKLNAKFGNFHGKSGTFFFFFFFCQNLANLGFQMAIFHDARSILDINF